MFIEVKTYHWERKQLINTAHIVRITPMTEWTRIIVTDWDTDNNGEGGSNFIDISSPTYEELKEKLICE